MKRFIAVALIIILTTVTVAVWDASGQGPSRFVSARTLTVWGHFATGGALVGGTHTFTTTAIRDTVRIAGALSTDKYFVSANNDTSSISYISKTDTLIALRKSGGLTGATWNWLRVEIR